MNQIFNYLKKLTESESAESSKRFIAITTMISVHYLVIRFTNIHNIELILGELLGFVLVLLGVAAWQSVKKSQSNEIRKSE